MEIIAYEMKFYKDIIEQSNISCIPFEEQYLRAVSDDRSRRQRSIRQLTEEWEVAL